MMSGSSPFDHVELDRLLRAAGIDVLLASSKHNVRYLLGGHVNQFFGVMDAIGTSRYLPILVYVPGRPELAHYVASIAEEWYLTARDRPLWVTSVRTDPHSSTEAASAVFAWLRDHGLADARIAIEAPFLPADAFDLLRECMPDAEWRDAVEPLESLRAVKSAAELQLVRACSDAIVDSMLDTFAAHGPGDTKAEIEQTLRRHQVARGLTYEYCLISMGSSSNRAPSKQPLEHGDVVCLDSGGQLGGYIGDVARMAVLGEPDDELESILHDIDAVQMAARAVVEPGRRAADIIAAADRERLGRQGEHPIHFVAHGMGLISHEAPRLTAAGPVRYQATHGDLPLRAGWVLSIESWVEHPRRGFIKLEDTVAVSADGHQAFGDHGRGWNRIGR